MYFGSSFHRHAVKAGLASIALALGACSGVDPEEGSEESSSDPLIEGRDNMLRTATQPSNRDRDFRCPVNYATPTAKVNGRTVTFAPATAPAAADWSALAPIVSEAASPGSLKLAVILIHRVNRVPHYYYVSNGTQNDAVQTWSSSKFMAFAAGASQLREESGGRVGISGETVDTRGGWVPVGDLMSIATIYRTRVAPYNSNNLGTWMQNVSGRAHSTGLVQSWLGRGGESFAGGYGEDGSRLTGKFRGPGGAVYETRLSSAGAGSNSMSMLTTAEFLKRLVMHREDATTRLPAVQWEDLQTIFYGASPDKTKYFKDRDIGGMQGGPSIYTLLPAGGWNSNALEVRSKGQFRHISKIGYGDAQGVYHSYNCLPQFDASGALTGGVEFVISARYRGSNIDGVLTRAVGATTSTILDGTIGGRGGQAAPIPATRGAACAPGCVFSQSCNTRPFTKYPASDGVALVCVQSGSCETECTPAQP